MPAGAIWALFAGYRIWRSVSGPPWQWQDSATYIAAARHPLLSVAFLAGQRAPVVPLLWKLTGTPESYVVTQTVLAVAAWSVLALTVARLARPGWAATVAGTAVLGFATCWKVLEWDWSVLSESVSLSCVALIAAATIWLSRRFSLPRAATLVAACVVYEGARDQAIWAAGATGIGLVAWAALRGEQPSRRPAARGNRRSPRRLAALGLVLLATAGLGEAGAAYSGRNVVNVEDVFVVRIFPFPSRVAWFARHGMPQSASLDALARTTPAKPGKAEVVGPDLQASSWAPLAGWFDHRAEVTFLEFVATHPGYDLTTPFRRPELTFNDAGGNLAFYGVVGNGTRSFLPVLPALLFPSWPVEAALAAGSLALVALRRRHDPELLAALAALALTGALSMLIAWQGDGMEVARHTVEGSVQVRLAVLVLALLAVLPLRDRSEPNRAGLS